MFCFFNIKLNLVGAFNKNEDENIASEIFITPTLFDLSSARVTRKQIEEFAKKSFDFDKRCAFQICKNDQDFGDYNENTLFIKCDQVFFKQNTPIEYNGKIYQFKDIKCIHIITGKIDNTENICFRNAILTLENYTLNFRRYLQERDLFFKKQDSFIIDLTEHPIVNDFDYSINILELDFLIYMIEYLIKQNKIEESKRIGNIEALKKQRVELIDKINNRPKQQAQITNQATTQGKNVEPESVKETLLILAIPGSILILAFVGFNYKN